jgi:hypothetical protein
VHSRSQVRPLDLDHVPIERNVWDIMAQYALPPGMDIPGITDLDAGRAALLAPLWRVGHDGARAAESMAMHPWSWIALQHSDTPCLTWVKPCSARSVVRSEPCNAEPILGPSDCSPTALWTSTVRCEGQSTWPTHS